VSSLVVNGHAVLKVERDGGQITAISVRAPVKGDALKVTTIERAVEPALFATLLVSAAANGHLLNARLTDDERSRLTQIGLLIPPDRISAPVLYACDPTDMQSTLAITRVPRRMPMPETAGLCTSATFRRLGRDGPPPAMRGRLSLRNPFAADRSWVIVDDAPLAAPRIYSCRGDPAAAMEQLEAGQPVPASIAPPLREQLLEAGVIRSAATTAREREQRLRDADAARRQLADRRYATLRGLIPPLQLAAARRYYRALIAEGFLPFGDAEWPDRYFAAKEPLAYFFHQQLTTVITRVACEPVKPSFCFFASYRPGAELPPHTDREQCEYSLSIPIDQSPEPTDVSSWPLFLQPRNAPAATPIAVGLGGGVLYHGREVTHFRARLAAADFCSFWFFFYVPEAFAGPLD